jgi:pyrroloquinoline quinone (PQQ) biosynthesis protein C
MAQEFRREGDLKDLSSYPLWLQDVVRSTDREKSRIVDHEFFALMRDAMLPKAAMRKFLRGAWPTIEQFPQFMAMNLKKVRFGNGYGEDLARRFLIHNIRVEQKHADLWVDWASSVDLSLQDLTSGEDMEIATALTHWCWYASDSASLAAAIAATNYAVEGLTGEWSCVVCSKSTYADSLPEPIRNAATRWLRVHAHYDDAHPWEALEIIAALLGHSPSAAAIDEVRRAIRSTYIFFEMGLAYPMAELMHGSFDETASNASTLGDFDSTLGVLDAA